MILAEWVITPEFIMVYVGAPLVVGIMLTTIVTLSWVCEALVRICERFIAK